MNNVIINRGQGGLGRQPLGQDYISGLVFYPGTAALNALGVAAPKVYKFGGISDAVAAGFNNNHIDESPAKYACTVTNGGTGDVYSFYFNDPINGTVLMCTYTQTALDTADLTGAVLAGNIANAITSNSSYGIANLVTNTFDITARPGLGRLPLTGAVTYTKPLLSAFSLGAIGYTAGTPSQVDVYYYHINRFFTQTPASTLYVGLYSVSTPDWTAGWAFPEVSSIQNFATGSIRQLGVFVEATTFVPGLVTAIQAQVNTQIAKNAPLSVLLGADMSGVLVSSLGNLSSLNSEHVSVIAGQDGGAQGSALFSTNGYSITQLGDTLGLLASSQVSDDIAWVATYTLSPDGVENAVPAFATGQLLSALSDGDVNGMDSYRYIFGRQFVNDSPNGTFVNDSHCATAYTSDYAYIENNRTFDKASRQLYAAYIEQLAAPLVLNPDGTLSNSTVAYFEGLGEEALSNMAQANPNTGRPELSGFKVFINPAQNVLANSTLIVSVKLQPVGVAREIIINLQFTVSL